jgi:hypothetical protein
MLRELHQHAPELILLSGNAEHPCEADAIITPAISQAGIPVPPANLNPNAPAGFSPAWIGDYYKICTRGPTNQSPLIAARFGGFLPNEELSEFWKQGSSLKKSGRITKTQHIKLETISSGDLIATLEGSGKDGTRVSIQAADAILGEATIQNGRFAIQQHLHLPRKTKLIISTSGEGVFWNSLLIQKK